MVWFCVFRGVGRQISVFTLIHTHTKTNTYNTSLASTWSIFTDTTYTMSIAMLKCTLDLCVVSGLALCAVKFYDRVFVWAAPRTIALWRCRGWVFVEGREEGGGITMMDTSMQACIGHEYRMCALMDRVCCTKQRTCTSKYANMENVCILCGLTMRCFWSVSELSCMISMFRNHVSNAFCQRNRVECLQRIWGRSAPSFLQT